VPTDERERETHHVERFKARAGEEEIGSRLTRPRA
jgi:hypothetical protein